MHRFFILVCSLFAGSSTILAYTDLGFANGVSADSELDTAFTRDAPLILDIDCAGMHYEYMEVKNINVRKFRSRWNFHADRVEGCAQACNQVINFDCKTFIFKHSYPGSLNGTCMLSETSEQDIEPVKVCFGSHCKNDLYYRIGCVPITCDNSSCPKLNSSVCHEGMEVQYHDTQSGSCCPFFADCVCKPQSCPPLTEEPTGPGIVSVSKDDVACCPKWDVICNTTACPTKEQLENHGCSEAGERVSVEMGHCCKEAKCVCQVSLCPLPAQCQDDEFSEVIEGRCCNISLCKPKPKVDQSPASIATFAPLTIPYRNGTDIYPQCVSSLRDHGHIDPVWCEVILRVEEAENQANLLFGLVTAFLVIVIIGAVCAVIVMAVTLAKVGKNKLA